MDRDLSNFVPQTGMDVIGADGEKVGEIDAVERDYFIVRKGFFFPQDHYIPMSAISSYDEEGKIYLNVTKDEALEQEWSNPPAASTGTLYGDTTTSGSEFQAADTDRTANVDTDYVETDRDTVLGSAGTAAGTRYDTDVVDTGVGAGTYDSTRTDIGDRDTVDVVEEDLTATTRPVERGEVRVHKDVIEEQASLEVPVTEEEVEITRRRVDRPITDADHAFEEGTIEVPLRGEEVDVEKRARVVEEVEIDKTARQHTEQVSDTVRREEVHVEGDNVDVERTDRDRTNDVL